MELIRSVLKDVGRKTSSKEQAQDRGPCEVGEGGVPNSDNKDRVSHGGWREQCW